MPNQIDAVYATGRVFLDADSHIMELPGFIEPFADPSIRARLPPISTEAAGAQGEGFDAYIEAGAHSPEQVRELERNVIGGPKGYHALGAFNSGERSRALDLLGSTRSSCSERSRCPASCTMLIWECGTGDVGRTTVRSPRSARMIGASKRWPCCRSKIQGWRSPS